MRLIIKKRVVTRKKKALEILVLPIPASLRERVAHLIKNQQEHLIHLPRKKSPKSHQEQKKSIASLLDSPDFMSSSVLVLIAPGFEEIEAIVPIDLLRRAEALVTLASCSGNLIVTGRSSITLTTDCLLDELSDPFAYDLLILPGGPAVFDLRKRPEVLNLIREFGTMGKLIGAICAAPLLLLDTGLITKESACTAHGSTIGEIPQLSQKEQVVQDGRLITSRGAGTSVEFGLSLINRLFGPEKMSEIRTSIHADLPSPR